MTGKHRAPRNALTVLVEMAAGSYGDQLLASDAQAALDALEASDMLTVEHIVMDHLIGETDAVDEALLQAMAAAINNEDADYFDHL